MNIAYVVSDFPSLSETFVLREIGALRDLGIGVEIFALRRPPGPVHPEAGEWAAHVRYRPAFLAPGAIQSRLAFLSRAPRLCLRLLVQLLAPNLRRPALLLRLARNFPAALHFARLARDLGVTHIHAHFAYIPADVARVMAALLRLPFSVSAHAWDIYTADAPALDRRLRDAAFVAVCTQRALDHLTSLLPSLPPERLALIRHGLPLDEFQPANSIRPTILAVGRFQEKKGFVFLVESCRILKKRGLIFKCVIAGDGPTWPAIRNLVRQYDVEDRVELPGPLPQDRVKALYREAGVFVMPSIVARDGDRDGLPNVVLEALAMRLPVIATSASAADEAVADGENGFIIPAGNAHALADSIETILKDETLRRRMGERGRDVVLRRFDITRNTDALARRFADAAGAAQPPRG